MMLAGEQAPIRCSYWLALRGGRRRPLATELRGDTIARAAARWDTGAMASTRGGAGETPAFDLRAYLQRIGLDPATTPGVAEVHRAHSLAIPFENLDPHGGRPVSLDPGELQRKLVAGRRGGYCFEQNLLLGAALQALGATVAMYLARVRYRAPAGVVRPRSHLVLEVESAGERWHADVGFGLGSPLEPLPWGPGSEREIAGWRYRIVQDGDEVVLQLHEQGEWTDLYGFLAHPVPQVDVETVNWWVCTHPRSPFVSGLIASVPRADGTRVTLSDWNGLALSERTPAGETVTPVALQDVPCVLREQFALGGFALAEGPGGAPRVLPA
jgi:N-hydroxyarylamine O-acetyltransferase